VLWILRRSIKDRYTYRLLAAPLPGVALPPVRHTAHTPATLIHGVVTYAGQKLVSLLEGAGLSRDWKEDATGRQQ